MWTELVLGWAGKGVKTRNGLEMRGFMEENDNGLGEFKPRFKTPRPGCLFLYDTLCISLVFV